MLELIFFAILLGINLGFFLYLNRRLSVTRAIENFRESGILEEVAGSFIEQGMAYGVKLWSEGGEELVTSFRDTIAEKIKMSVLGQKGGIASGESRQTSMLIEAGAQDILNNQSPLLSVLAKQFPSVMELISENPGLIQYIPTMLQRFGIDPNKAIQGLVGGNTSQQTTSNGDKWWV